MRMEKENWIEYCMEKLFLELLPHALFLTFVLGLLSDWQWRCAGPTG